MHDIFVPNGKNGHGKLYRTEKVDTEKVGWFEPNPSL